jgi:hypothetical protein
VTNFVTETDALVLSPTTEPDGPEGVVEILDAFARFTAGLVAERLFKTTDDDGRVLLAASQNSTVVFRPTVLLKDGRTAWHRLPAAWQGRITRDVVTDFLHASAELSLRPPSWGAHANIVGSSSEHRVQLHFGVQTPRIDPYREIAAWDDARHVPLEVKLTGDCGDLLTPWEQVDALLGREEVSPLWLERRKRRVIAPSGQWWYEVRGYWEKQDPQAYRGMQDDPLPVTVYLGWAAYLWDAAGPPGQCPMCGQAVVRGRLYCGTPECDRRRNAARQQDSRRARQTRSKWR